MIAGKFYLELAPGSKIYKGTELIWPTEVQFATHDLLFTDRENMNNVAQELTATSGTFAARAVDAISLPAGVNGRIYSDLNSVANNNAILGFYDAPTKVALGSIKAGFDLGGDNHYYEVQPGSVVDSGYVMTYPKKAGLFRVGACCKPQISVDGVTWQDLHIFRGNYLGFQNAGEIWPELIIYQAGNGLCSQPKIDVYEAGDVANLYLSCGNSIAAGLIADGVLSQNNVGQQGWVYLDGNHDWFYNTKAVQGQDIDAAISAFPSAVAPFLVDGFHKIIVSYLEGTNELATSTAAEAFAKLQDYINLVLNAHPSTRILIYMTPSCDPSLGTTNVKRVAFNELIAGLIGTNSKIKVLDIRGDSILDGATSYQNATYFWDGFHPTQALIDYMASLANPILASF